MNAIQIIELLVFTLMLIEVAYYASKSYITAYVKQMIQFRFHLLIIKFSLEFLTIISFTLIILRLR